MFEKIELLLNKMKYKDRDIKGFELENYTVELELVNGDKITYNDNMYWYSFNSQEDYIKKLMLKDVIKIEKRTNTFYVYTKNVVKIKILEKTPKMYYYFEGRECYCDGLFHMFNEGVLLEQIEEHNEKIKEFKELCDK